MALKESQIYLQEHSEVKIKLLKLYLEGYLSILHHSYTVNDIYLFDLFCGEGIYDNGGKGSPIIILETICGVQKEKQNITKFHCHFNDIDPDKIDKVKKHIYNSGFNSKKNILITFSCIDYRELVPKLVKEFMRHPNRKVFIFIDPYGYKDVTVEDLRLLLKSNNSEILLFLPTQFMFRFAENATPQCLISFINELVPENLWPLSSTGLDFIENLKNKFREYFAFSNKHYVDSFIITRNKNQYFCLFFFTSHILGFEKMLDAKWKIDEEEGRGWTFEPKHSLFSNLTKKPNIIKFKKQLRSYLIERKRSNGEVYHFTVSNGHRPSHAVQILKNFQEVENLEIMGSDGKPLRKPAFYINYRYYSREPNKVYLKIK